MLNWIACNNELKKKKRIYGDISIAVWVQIGSNRFESVSYHIVIASYLLL
jgi:hypothetical protein